VVIMRYLYYSHILFYEIVETTEYKLMLAIFFKAVQKKTFFKILIGVPACNIVGMLSW
jgi:hypothetical protein